MSSATLTEGRRAGGDRGGSRADAAPDAAGGGTVHPSLFFGLTTGAIALAAAIVLRNSPAAEIALAVLTVAAAGLGAFALYRTLNPLTARDDLQGPALVGGRTRAALERDKSLTLRAIKELEFDHAMHKVSDADFVEMRARLRARALRLMQQLEGSAGYRDRIERDVERRLATRGEAAPEARPQPRACDDCGAVNEPDARFCKMCGHALAR